MVLNLNRNGRKGKTQWTQGETEVFTAMVLNLNRNGRKEKQQ
jgi:hypothetical protein